MRRGTSNLCDRQFQDILEHHRRIAPEPLVFRSHFPGTVLEQPRWIRQECCKTFSIGELAYLKGLRARLDGQTLEAARAFTEARNRLRRDDGWLADYAAGTR